jgi:hypothetical protein
MQPKTDARSVSTFKPIIVTIEFDLSPMEADHHHKSQAGYQKSVALQPYWYKRGKESGRSTITGRVSNPGPFPSLREKLRENLRESREQHLFERSKSRNIKVLRRVKHKAQGIGRERTEVAIPS